MILQDLGYTEEFELHRKTHNLESFDVARVITEHKERYIVKTEEREFEAEILGNLRYTAQSRSDFPAVGDWVAISVYDDEKAIIHSVYERQTLLQRQSVGRAGEKQIIAANIDSALIVQAVDRDFSINRFERYLTICHTARVKPIIVLNKIDLVDETTLNELITNIRQRIPNVPVLAVSNASNHGIEELKAQIKKGQTYCLLGSSGVGKSTLLNTLAGETWAQTDTISAFSNRGRHITTHRELHMLPGGGIVIDNPGMREVGIADATDGVNQTFDFILELAADCKFSDCAHISETGCAVIAAVERGELDEAAYENYLKMEREKAHFESTIAEKRQKDKDFGKMVKTFKKIKKR